MARRDVQRTIGLRASRRITLRFGMLAVEMGTGPALDASARVSGTLRTADGQGVKQVYRSDSGEILERANLVTQYAAADGSYVTLEDGDVQAIGGTDGGVTLTANLAADEVPSEWVQSTNLAWPSETAADEGYMLVASYLRGTGRVLVGTFAERGTTKVLAVRWSDVYGCIIVQTLAYHAQVRHANVQAIQDGLATLADPTDEMIDLAGKLFGAIADDFAWDEVRDEYGERMAEVIEEKAATGQVTSKAPEKVAAGSAPDVLAMLKASLEGVAA